MVRGVPNCAEGGAKLWNTPETPKTRAKPYQGGREVATIQARAREGSRGERLSSPFVEPSAVCDTAGLISILFLTLGLHFGFAFPVLLSRARFMASSSRLECCLGATKLSWTGNTGMLLRARLSSTSSAMPLSIR